MEIWKVSHGACELRTQSSEPCMLRWTHFTQCTFSLLRPHLLAAGCRVRRSRSSSRRRRPRQRKCGPSSKRPSGTSKN